MNPRVDDRDQWLCSLELGTAVAMLVANGATDVLYKVLPPNANSKNQVYLAPDLSELSRIPSGSIAAHSSYSSKKKANEPVFHASLNLYWVTSEGKASLAPEAKLIFYPQYPEVRLSGMLKGARYAPSSFFDKGKRGAEPDRILLLGITTESKVLALVAPPDGPLAREVRDGQPHEQYGSMHILPTRAAEFEEDDYLTLVSALASVHRSGWHDSIRLNRFGEVVACKASNCNGNTLEALLGIRSNGIALPDFHGWEIKARSVTNWERPGSSVVTLFTPEPDGGTYVSGEFEQFMAAYGHSDRWITHRTNFGGIYRAGVQIKPAKKLRLDLDGYNRQDGTFRHDGAVVMLNATGDVAMSWSFAKLLDHWKVKHSKAAYVPSQIQRGTDLRYRYGKKVLLGQGAAFDRLLSALARGDVYYDPGIKLEKPEGGKPSWKKRSQFRIKSASLDQLYDSSREIDVEAEFLRISPRIP